ncbi:MAG TPA: glycosyltransferase family 4 protein [Gammaproteobacteria bacterium]|nr:glycosyltransferase family 4 protein [Gammaproteobacteria bacterium]
MSLAATNISARLADHERQAEDGRPSGQFPRADKPARLMLVIYSLARGGAERVMSTLANSWAAQGREVILVTMDKQDSDAYKLMPQINRVPLGMAASPRNTWQILWNNLRRLYILRATAKQVRPDVVVSFTANVNTLTVLALLGLRMPVIVSERTDPSQMDIGKWRSRLRKVFYPRAAAVVVQTQKVLADMQRQIPGAHLAVIPNPVPHADPDAEYLGGSMNDLLGLPAAAKIIAGMGRLDTEKGFDLLIEAFRSVFSEYPDWHLVIFGKGPALEALEAQVAATGLNNRVHLPGQVLAARMYLSQAEIFVLSSRFEGFPNVLVEAMACGCAVISFDCPSGPGEIVRNGHDGLLVKAGDVRGLAAAMRTLMVDPAHRAELGRNARQVAQRFSIERVMGLWDQLLGETMSGRTRRLNRDGDAG